jgi:hypothetical protein
MNRKYRFASMLTAATLTLASVPALYASTHHNDNNGPLERFYVATDGRVFFRMKNLPPNHADCKGGWYYVAKNHAQRDKLFETLVLAWMTGEKAFVGVIDGYSGASECPVEYILMNR